MADETEKSGSSSEERRHHHSRHGDHHKHGGAGRASHRLGGGRLGDSSAKKEGAESRSSSASQRQARREEPKRRSDEQPPAAPVAPAPVVPAAPAAPVAPVAPAPTAPVAPVPVAPAPVAAEPAAPASSARAPAEASPARPKPSRRDSRGNGLAGLVKWLSFTGFRYNRMTKKDSWLRLRHFAIGAVPLLLLALAAHHRSLLAGRFWLDDSLLAADGFIQPAGIASLWWSTVEGMYAPLTFLTLWCERWLWGAGGNGYHVVNLGLHLLNVVLVWRLAKGLELRPPAPWFAAALFAVHPLGGPAVGWIFARGELLGTALLLSSLLAFIAHDKPNADDLDLGPLVWSAVFALLATLACPPLALALPLLALAGMGWRRGRKVDTGLRHLLRCLPLFLIAPLGWLAGQALRLGGQAPPGEASLGWAAQAVESGWRLWIMLGRLFWPTVRLLEGQHAGSSSVLFRWLPLAVCGGLLLVGFVFRKTAGLRGLFFAFFGGAALLVLPLALSPDWGNYRYGLHAGHWFYPATIPLLMLVAGVATAIWSWLGERAAVGANLLGLALVAATLAAALVQVDERRDREALWRRIAEQMPEAWIGHHHLGMTLAGEGRRRAAIPALRRAVALKPEDAATRKQLGLALLAEGEKEEAQRHLTKSFEADPSLADATLQKQIIEQYEAIGNNPQSLTDFLNISSLPGRQKVDALAYDELAFATNETVFGPRFQKAYEAIERGDLAQAATIVEKLQADDPGGALGSYLGGYLAFENNRLREAVRLLQQAVDGQPDLAGAYYLLGVVKGNLGDAASGFRDLLQAARLRPKMAEAYFQLGRLAEASQLWEKAIEYYATAIFVRADYVQALLACADLLATHPDARFRNADQALKLAQKAAHLTAEPDAALLSTLAAAYAESGHFRDAVGNAKRAVRAATVAGERSQAQARLEAFEQGQPYRRPL